jgi:hypothetical protein
MEWNDAKYVLPDCDDIYEVLLGPLFIQKIDSYYDGKGFLHKGEYLSGVYWRIRTKDLPKRYGKIDGSNTTKTA